MSPLIPLANPALNIKSIVAEARGQRRHAEAVDLAAWR